MRYLLAILLPPLAVLSCGQPFQSAFNLILTFCLWLPGSVHAIMVVHEFNEDRRTGRIVDAMRHWPVAAA